MRMVAVCVTIVNSYRIDINNSNTNIDKLRLKQLFCRIWKGDDMI